MNSQSKVTVYLLSFLIISVSSAFAKRQRSPGTLQQAQQTLSRLKDQRGSLLSIKKGEFEKTSQFEARKKKDQQQIVRIDDDICSLLKEAYPAAVSGVAETRQGWMTVYYVKDGIMFGAYNADKEILPVTALVMGGGTLSEQLSLNVSPSAAKYILANQSQVKSSGQFFLEYDGKFYLKGVLTVSIGARRYHSAPSTLKTHLVLEHIFEAHSQVYSVCFSTNDSLIASGGADGSVKIWNLSNWREFQTIAASGKWIGPVAFSPDGQTIASGGGDDTIRLCRVRDGKMLRAFIGHTKQINSVSFSPDGQILASASADQKTGLWRTSHGDSLKFLQAGGDQAFSAIFSPDGKTLCTCGGGSWGNIALWRTDDWGLIRRFAFRTRSVSFSPDGSMIASAAWDDPYVQIWRANSGQRMGILNDDRNFECVAFSPNGKYLIAAGVGGANMDQGVIDIWQTSDWLLIHQLNTSYVYSLCFNSEGDRFASADADGTVKLWHIVSIN